MNITTCNTKNPYRTKKNFLTDPFASLYQTSDEEILQNESVENLIHYAWSLEECISGDFDLRTVVTEIKSQILSFVRTGLLAYKVKIFKLYRNVHKNFKTFCEKALGISHWQINRKIEAARVVIELAQAGFSVLPTCEAQARPLTKLYGAELCNKWKMVVDSLKPHTITSNQINEVLGVETKTTNLRLPKKLYEQIRKKALEMGLSIEQLLNIIFEDDQKIKPVEEEILAKWEEDMEIITNEEKKSIQKDEESVPIGTLSSSFCSQNTPVDILAKKSSEIKITENLEFTNSNLELSQNNFNSKTKKSKNSKKPLFEILNFDRKDKLKKEKTKKIEKLTNQIDKTINNAPSKTDE